MENTRNNKKGRIKNKESQIKTDANTKKGEATKSHHPRKYNI